jgi:ubiquinone biosynthesis protein
MPKLSRDIDEMLDLYADVSLGDLAMRDVFRSITDTMARHRLKLPADLLLLIKAVTTIEAVGCQLDPSFKIVGHATPFVQSLIAHKHSPTALALRTADASRDVLMALRTLPGAVANLVRRAQVDGLQVQFVHRNLDFFVREMDRSSNRLSFAIVIGALVIASSIVVHSAVGPVAFGYPALGVAGFLIAGFLGIGLAIGILRSGRL